MTIEFGAYYILSNEVQDRWERMVRLQRQIWPDWDRIPKVFVVDSRYGHTPGLPPGEVVRIKLFDPQGHILFSRAKNAGLDWASRAKLDWILDADADSVIVTPPRRPETQYSSMLCHFQTSTESFADLASGALAGTLGARHFSRFLFGRPVFDRFRFDEEFFGYAGEDVDFHLNLIQRNGISWSESGMRGINLWHELGPRWGNISRLDLKSRGLL